MHTTLSYGEILWDVFPDYKKPGGSPANLAYHLHCLKNRSLLMSRVGKDENGDELLNFLIQKGVLTDHIQHDNSRETGKVTVHFDGNEPSYTIHEPSAWDYIEMTNDISRQSSEIDAVCFASLSQRNDQSAETLQHILNSVPESCLTVFDLNLRPPFINKELILKNIDQSDVIKLNEEEYKTVSNWACTDSLADDLIKQDRNKTVLITLGADGSAMYNSDGYFKHDAFPISGNGDFVGVGDAFLACFTHLNLLNTPNDDILRTANQYAAYVASQQGGMPEIPKQIIEQVQSTV